MFLNLHPDRLEVVNPGRLPLGVTPHNILHASRRRNDGLARVFHDLGLMEREGSGFDMMYEHLLASGRRAPEASEGPDSVKVVVPRRLIRPEVIRLLREAQARFPLNQRERIALGLLAQGEGLTATEFAEQLELIEPAEVSAWIGRLTTWDLVQQTGRTRATRYFVSPDLLYSAGFVLRTTLKRVQPHRLRALVVEDLERYPNSSSSEIHGRVGSEIGARTLKRALDALVAEGLVTFEGTGGASTGWRRRPLLDTRLEMSETTDQGFLKNPSFWPLGLGHGLAVSERRFDLVQEGDGVMASRTRPEPPRADEIRHIGCGESSGSSEPGHGRVARNRPTACWTITDPDAAPAVEGIG